MESSEITRFILDTKNFWIVFGVGIFLIVDGIALRYLIAKNYLKTAKGGHKKTNFAHNLLSLSAILTATMGIVIISTAVYFSYMQ